MRRCDVYVSVVIGLCVCLAFQFASFVDATHSQCSLNGDWSSNKCQCDPGWKGQRCEQLDLIPMPVQQVEQGAYRPKPQTSWGANVLRSDEDNLYHMFVSQLQGNCTLTSWIPNSQVVHAVSDSPVGPFQFREVLFDTFHHNPRLHRAPDGTYLLFMIGGSHAGTAGEGNCSALPPEEGELLDTRIIVSSSPSLNGPWSTPSDPLVERGAETEWDYVVTNPSPIVFPNGTTLLYYRGTPKYWNKNHWQRATDLPESVGVARAPHWSGPYTKLFKMPILSVMNEDPFAWRDSRGFHLLTHGRDDWWNTHHSYSTDGLNWSDGSDIAADPNITLVNGSIYRFTNRERPMIYFNETTGRPAILFTGVCPGEKYTYAYTLAQYIKQERG